MLNAARAIELAFENPADSKKLMALVKFDLIRWKRRKQATLTEIIYSDATISQVGAIVNGVGYAQKIKNLCCERSCKKENPKHFLLIFKILMSIPTKHDMSITNITNYFFTKYLHVSV